MWKSLSACLASSFLAACRRRKAAYCTASFLVRAPPMSVQTRAPPGCSSTLLPIHASSDSGSYNRTTPLRVRKPVSSAKGLVEVVPRVVWRVACTAEALPRTLAFRSPPLGGLLVLPREGGVLAFVVTPCSLQAGSVRSCILRIPMVQVPSAHLQSLQIPSSMAHVTMSPAMPKSRTLRSRSPPPTRAGRSGAASPRSVRAPRRSAVSPPPPVLQRSRTCFC